MDFNNLYIIRNRNEYLPPGSNSHICDSQFVFSVYLTDYMFHTTMLEGNILRVHYKNMKCDVLFSQDNISTLFRSNMYSCLCKISFPACSSAKIIKSKRVFPDS